MPTSVIFTPVSLAASTAVKDRQKKEFRSSFVKNQYYYGCTDFYMLATSLFALPLANISMAEFCTDQTFEKVQGSTHARHSLFQDSLFLKNLSSHRLASQSYLISAWRALNDSGFGQASSVSVGYPAYSAVS